jgi:hypothetical protein
MWPVFGLRLRETPAIAPWAVRCRRSPATPCAATPAEPPLQRQHQQRPSTFPFGIALRETEYCQTTEWKTTVVTPDGLRTSFRSSQSAAFAWSMVTAVFRAVAQAARRRSIRSVWSAHIYYSNVSCPGSLVGSSGCGSQPDRSTISTCLGHRGGSLRKTSSRRTRASDGPQSASFPHA